MMFGLFGLRAFSDPRRVLAEIGGVGTLKEVLSALPMVFQLSHEKHQAESFAFVVLILTLDALIQVGGIALGSDCRLLFLNVPSEAVEHVLALDVPEKLKSHPVHLIQILWRLGFLAVFFDKLGLEMKKI